MATRHMFEFSDECLYALFSIGKFDGTSRSAVVRRLIISEYERLVAQFGGEDELRKHWESREFERRRKRGQQSSRWGVPPKRWVYEDDDDDHPLPLAENIARVRG
jgi:hypothetical protein